jgi:putative chitobiose transport system permease protein
MIERRPFWLKALIAVAATVLALVSIGPAVWLIASSLQPPGTDLHSIAGKPTLANFASAWNDGGLGRPLINSVIVTALRATLNVLFAAAAAYPLARMKFAARNTVFVLLLCTLMVPEQVVLVPMFRIVVGLGLYDTLAAVILPFSVTAFGIFLCRQAFMQVPPSLEEAARIDGAGPLRIWWHVMLPLTAPTLATLALFSVIGAWSELLWPLIVLNSKSSLTLPVAVNTLLGVFAANARAAYAGAVLALIPIILIFLGLQRFMKPEMFGGAVKG